MKDKEMKFKINYSGEYEDSFILTGYSIEEIREKAYAECTKRGWSIDNCWSEEL